MENISESLYSKVQESDPKLLGGFIQGLGSSFPQDETIYRKFQELIELIHGDEVNLESFVDHWEMHINEEENEDISFLEIVEECAGGSYVGFDGSDAYDLYYFHYSSDPQCIKMLDWEHNGFIALEGGIVAHFFSHTGYDDHDSWAILEDTQSGELHHFIFTLFDEVWLS